MKKRIVILIMCLLPVSVAFASNGTISDWFQTLVSNISNQLGAGIVIITPQITCGKNYGSYLKVGDTGNYVPNVRSFLSQILATSTPKTATSTIFSEADAHLTILFQQLYKLYTTGTINAETANKLISICVAQIPTPVTGTVTISTDSSSPSYTIVAGGTTNVPILALKLRASGENATLQRIGFVLSNFASSSPADVVGIKIFDGATQVGSAVFTGSNYSGTTTFPVPVTLTKDVDKVLTIKADISQIGLNYPGTSGHIVAINYNDKDTLATRAIGASSGAYLPFSGATYASGVGIFRSIPTVTSDSLSGTGLADGRLMRFKVTADSKGDISVNQFKFKIGTSGSVIFNGANLYGYTDTSYSNALSGFPSAKISSSTVSTSTDNTITITPSAVVRIPAGATYYFELRGTVFGIQANSSINTTLLGDYSSPSLANKNDFMGTALLLASRYNNFIWSPNSTTTSLPTYVDWTNGYSIPGLPTSGITQTRSN